jgi:hypothetical protein
MRSGQDSSNDPFFRLDRVAVRPPGEAKIPLRNSAPHGFDGNGAWLRDSIRCLGFVAVLTMIALAGIIGAALGRAITETK